MMASSSRLKQGEQGAISARVATQGKSGVITETIEVETNDPKRPKVILTMVATIMENLLPSVHEDICR